MIFEKIDERSTAILLIYLFRKANRYPIDPAWEQTILATEPEEGLGTYLHNQIKTAHHKEKAAHSVIFGS